MTSIHVVENKISDVRKYLQILERYKGYSRGEIETNIDIRGAVERYLYLATQSAIDLAEAIISFKGLRKPSTLGESFSILCENGIVSAELTQKLIPMAGFRNVIAHDYTKIDYDKVYHVLHHGLQDLEAFIAAAVRL